MLAPQTKKPSAFARLYQHLYWSLRKSLALGRFSFSLTLNYQAEIIIWMIAGLFPLVMMFVWLSLASEGPVAGYSHQDFINYYLILFFVRQMTVVWLVWEMDPEIRLGRLSPLLLKPLSPYWWHFANHVTDKVIRLPILLVFLTLAFGLARQFPPFEVLNLFIFLLSLSLAFLMRFNLGFCIGSLAFWLHQATSFEHLFFSLYTVFSGVLAPIDLFPPLLRQLISFSPFPYMINFPVKVFLGELSFWQIVQGLLIQLFWVGFFALLKTWLWRKGLRHYGAVGA
ncbi:MAG: ABC-2 family transporter protein [Deinococcales bacterium]